MSSKQGLRLPIHLAKRLKAYLRAASALAGRGRIDSAGTSLQSSREEVERLLALSEPNADTRTLDASSPECAEGSGRQPAATAVPNGDDDPCG